MQRKGILKLIGKTPLVEIERLNPYKGVKIFAKLESFNPGGSIKDRIALFMIEGAEKRKELTKEKIIIEATSGNTGIGLALVGAVKGYKVMLVMSASASKERQLILKALGADILLTPPHLGTDGAIEEAYKLAREFPDKYYMPDQFNNEDNILAHYYTTGVEIWRQTKGKVNCVVASMGTTGTLMGISRRLKELNPSIEIVGMEPYLNHKIQGLKNLKESYRPGIFDKSKVDEILRVEDEEAFEMARRLAKEEGLFVGMSSGAAMVAALNKAYRMKKGILVVIFPDGGEKYLSTSLFIDKKRTDIKIYNFLTRKKEPFIPIRDGKVSIYTCGPTVNAPLHIGLWRRLVFADLLKRYLKFKDFDVTHVVNITDIDDSTIQGAFKANKKLSDFTQIYIDKFMESQKLLGIELANYYPKASEHIDDMIEITKKLLGKGLAYLKLGSLYFDISRFPDYGKFSRIDLQKIQLGKTVDLDEYEKENPRDFTLLKRSKLQEIKRGIYYKTEWGNLRPGWHIECPAMSMKYLGENFDIHTGSVDLIFPHHENEIAIGYGVTGKPLANYWVLNELVLEKGKKISHLSGKAITLEDLLEKGYKPKEIRYFLISAHYRKAIEFSFKKIDNARDSIKRLEDFIFRLNIWSEGLPSLELDQLIYDLKHNFIQAMDDDLNISSALASIFTFINKVNSLISKGFIDNSQKEKIINVMKSLDSVVNIIFPETVYIDEKTKELIKKREIARKEKNFKLADSIREKLLKDGIQIIDTPKGSIVKKIS